MPEIRDRCEFCGQPIELLTEGRDPFWVHVDRIGEFHSGLIPTRPRNEGAPRVELATTELGEVRPHLMHALDASGAVVGVAARAYTTPLWVAYKTNADTMQADLTEATAWRLLGQWAREGSS